MKDQTNKKPGQLDDRDEHGRYLPGHPGGPGRPRKELSITEHLRTKAFEAAQEGDPLRIELLAREAWDLALNSRDVRLKLEAMKFLANRLEGRPRQSVAFGPWNGEHNPAIAMCEQAMRGLDLSGLQPVDIDPEPTTS